MGYGLPCCLLLACSWQDGFVCAIELGSNPTEYRDVVGFVPGGYSDLLNGICCSVDKRMDNQHGWFGFLSVGRLESL